MKTHMAPLGNSLAIVLGAGVESDGTAAPRTKVRAKAASQLALAIPDLTVIATGDGRSAQFRRFNSRTEATKMSEILMSNGISPDRILLEHQACDTVGNAILTAARYLQYEKPRKIYVVTSPFHAARALVIFRGVLGPKWDIEAYLSEEIDGDAAKGAREGGGIDWALRFFECTTPGSIWSAVDRLLAIGKPQYRKMRWLTSVIAA